MSLGTSLAGFDPQTFTSIAGVEASAPTMGKDTIWVLTLSPPDPLAGLWAGTIGAGGVINWPTALDPNPPGGGLDDPFPAPLQTQIRGYNLNQVDTGIQSLPVGDAMPIIP